MAKKTKIKEIIDVDGQVKVAFGFSVKMSGEFQSAELSSHIEIPVKAKFFAEKPKTCRDAVYAMVSNEISSRVEELPVVIQELLEMSKGR